MLYVHIQSAFSEIDLQLYHVKDFGVWNVSYISVSCDAWEGSSNSSDFGAVSNLGNGVCCPEDPFVSRLCIITV